MFRCFLILAFPHWSVLIFIVKLNPVRSIMSWKTAKFLAFSYRLFFFKNISWQLQTAKWCITASNWCGVLLFFFQSKIIGADELQVWRLHSGLFKPHRWLPSVLGCWNNGSCSDHSRLSAGCLACWRFCSFFLLRLTFMLINLGVDFCKIRSWNC